MTRKDCEKIRKIDSEFCKMYGRNFRNAQKSFRCIIEIMRLIRPGVKIHLHHKILGCTNYEKWDVNELIPMFEDEHRLYHSYVNKGNGKYGVSCDDIQSYQKIRYKTIIVTESEEQRQQRLLADSRNKKKRRKEIRASESPEERLIRQKKITARAKAYRESLGENYNRERKNEASRKSKAKRLAAETPAERDERLSKQRKYYSRNRERMQKQRRDAYVRETQEKRGARLAAGRIRSREWYASKHKKQVGVSL